MSKNKKYYRNQVEIKGIDIDSLWELKGLILFLVDVDQFASANINDYTDVFYEVINPFPAKMTHH